MSTSTSTSTSTDVHHDRHRTGGGRTTDAGARPQADARGDGRRAGLGDDRGSATAEYAVVILAAVAFAGVLVAVMRSGEVQSILTDLVRGALSL
ncbi:DUF4244 domain-containing protein [Curtobacterium sp. ISL-83]|uniref:DUF4244 domain-containing protein n=1 Tax=Curtobacterium sp. ISL-83 TaxID=2819145 RepID=UPI0020353134|nr:DUF4244 domain-containing protein [Curtobacterium sp. ISL-83]